jgi:acyl carrier protein
MSYSKTETISAAVNAPTSSVTERDIQAHIVGQMAGELNISPHEIDITEPFNRYGLDSMAAVHLIADLEKWLGVELSPTLPYEYPTVQSLAEYLVTLKNEKTGRISGGM